jgi:molybdate transport system substrate-binding protein
MFIRFAWRLLLVVLAFGSPAHAQAKSARPLTVFAAASLTEVLQKVGDAYAATGHPLPRFSFAASSALARQIEAGATADIFFSADQEWMDYLATRGLIRTATRQLVLGNSLVLIAPADSTLALRIEQGFPLAQTLGRGRLATGDPDTVPVGRYARGALMSLGVWNEVADRLVPADNVRVALAYIARGEAPLGIVYLTDARSEPRVKILDTFPAGTHLPITYPIAITTTASTEAEPFRQYVLGEAAAEIFRAAGFVPLRKPATP